MRFWRPPMEIRRRHAILAATYGDPASGARGGGWIGCCRSRAGWPDRGAFRREVEEEPR
jgi:hypothetical protein